MLCNPKLLFTYHNSQGQIHCDSEAELGLRRRKRRESPPGHATKKTTQAEVEQKSRNVLIACGSGSIGCSNPSQPSSTSTNPTPTDLGKTLPNPLCCVNVSHVSALWSPLFLLSTPPSFSHPSFLQFLIWRGLDQEKSKKKKKSDYCV
jgi:hypothetical protein